MSRYEKQFDLENLQQDWYHTAVGEEFFATWGDLPLFKADIPHLEFMRVQTCWLEASLEDLQARKRSVYSLARSVLAPADVPDLEIIKWWPLFGVESVSSKLADAICTLYNDPPYREFSTDPDMQKAFAELYDLFEVNHTMKDAYRSSLFTNVVALIPDWDTKKIKVLTPDYFRIVENEGIISELWIAKGYGGFYNKEFEVWSKESLKLVDHSGKLIKSESNPYGRIPAVLLKLNRSNDIYGSGITEASEISAWSNFINFISTRVGVFQSYSVGIATNLDLQKGTRVGPGYMLNTEMKVGDGVPKPAFEYVSPDGKFLELEEYKQNRVQAFERNQGLPGFLVDEGAGQPPTGAALQVLERQLNEKRKEHSYALNKAEKDLASLIATLAKVDGLRDITADKLTVQFAEQQTFGDPYEELQNDVLRMGQGLTSPSVLVLKYFNKRMTDEEAAAFIAQNKKFFPSAPVQETSVPKNIV